MSRKTKSGIIIMGVAIICCAITIAFFYAQINLKKKSMKADLFTLVPHDSKAILETNNINMLFESLDLSSFRKQYEALNFSELLTFLSNKVDDRAEQKGHGLSVPMSNVLISFHAPGDPKDQVLYGHLGNGDLDLIDNIFKELNTTGYAPKEVEYKGKKLKIYPLSNHSFITCYFQTNCYAISFQKKLIEKVVDTILEKDGIKRDSAFAQVYKNHKNDNGVRLYAYTAPLSEWTQYDMRIQNNSIYLNGFCSPGENANKNSFVMPLIHGAKKDLITADALPDNTLTFYQVGIQDIHLLVRSFAKTDSIPYRQPMPGDEGGEAFYQFVDNFTQGELRSIEFLGRRTPETNRVLELPIKFPRTQVVREWNKLAKETWKSAYKQNKRYRLYSLPNNYLLKHLLGNNKEDGKTVSALLTENYLLLSREDDDLRDYMNKRTYTPATQELWKTYLSDLASKANFTFYSDMNEVNKHAKYFKNVLPPIFFRHIDFFRQFFITVQFIETDETMNATIILDHKPV